MAFNDDFFKKVEKKTKVDKNTIISLAEKLQKGNMKDENTIREVIQSLSAMTGKNVSKEKEDKIVNAVLKDKIPDGVDKMF
jgi:predicted DNA-binding protein (UPF0278 family)